VPLLGRVSRGVMELRRSTRVGAISRTSTPSYKASQTIGKVEPNRVTKRGKTSRVSESLKASLPDAPTPKRKRNGPLIPPKAPAEACLTSTPSRSRATGHDSSPASANRPADPHQTNAPLVSPESSRVIAYTDGLIPSGIKNAGLHPTRTTGNILEEACAHLIKIDPTLQHVIDKHPCRIFSPEGLAEEIDPFVSLASSIISQQVWTSPNTDAYGT
jgi:DNA-3-methyladenine glycosylase II